MQSAETADFETSFIVLNGAVCATRKLEDRVSFAGFGEAELL
jgi:hypothetical protein